MASKYQPSLTPLSKLILITRAGGIRSLQGTKVKHQDTRTTGHPENSIFTNHGREMPALIRPIVKLTSIMAEKRSTGYKRVNIKSAGQPDTRTMIYSTTYLLHCCFWVHDIQLLVWGRRWKWSKQTLWKL